MNEAELNKLRLDVNELRTRLAVMGLLGTPEAEQILAPLEGTGSLVPPVRFVHDETAQTLNWIMRDGTEKQLVNVEAEAAASIWHALFNLQLAIDTGGWNGWTMRMYFPWYYLAHHATTKLKVMFQAAAGGGFTIANAYVGYADVDNLPDFTDTPTELLFSEGSGTPISAGGTATCDEIDFEIAEGQGIIVSWQCNSANDDTIYSVIGGGVTSYFDNVQEAGTVDVNAANYATDTRCYGIPAVYAY